MFGKVIVLIVSVLSLFLTYNFIRTSIAINTQYNSILVKPEADYCKRSDLYKFYHPEIVMKDTDTFREAKGVIREILRSSYYDCIPQMSYIDFQLTLL